MYGGQTNTNGNGVQICVEPLNEWKIQEIGYDGVEKYIKPLAFKDLLRKNARSIDWTKIVGDETVADTFPEESDSEDSQPGGKSNGMAQTSKGFIEPVAGPWAVVAKHLHYSLQEVNILLDCMRIARTDYLTPLVTALVQDERTEAEQVAVSKAFQLHTRRRVLNETAKEIERMANARRGISHGSEKSDFFSELRELRENWRIRKLGPNIFGDLGYKTCNFIREQKVAPKFAPHEIFDVTQKSALNRRESTVRFSNRSFIELRLPQDLRYRTNLLVFIEKDDEKCAGTFFKVSETPSTSEEDVKHVHWKNALPWAQNSLICKDILARLVSESVSQHDLITLTTENSIVISLFDSLLLKVEARFHLFGESRMHSDGVPYLSQCLRQLSLAEHAKKPKRVQQFVTLPLVSHTEGLDMRGPTALSAEEVAIAKINARSVASSSLSAHVHSSDLLIRRFIQYASHYVLMSRAVDFLENHMINFNDPQIQWKWIRATPVFSIVSLNFSSRGFENLGKFTSLIRISDSSITLVSKESQQIECRRDMEMFENALLLLAAHFLLNSSQVLSRAYGWQLFHANSNALDSAGNFAPTFYTCNQNGTKRMFVQFRTDGSPPSVFIKNDRMNLQKQFVSQNLDGFQRLNYKRIPGTTFMRKIDNLFAIFTN